VINTIFLLTIPSTNFILLELRELLQRARKEGLTVAYSIPDFVLYVLTPTMVLRLIMDDMSLDMIGAHQVMMDSARMGMFFYDDNIILS
jgi:RTC4-like domain